jgi:AmmeMemoRadiSam system protein B
LREALVRATGDLQVGEIEEHLISALSGAGFLEDDAFYERKTEVEKAFATAPVREAAHAGSGYPDEPSELRRTFTEYLNGSTADKKKLIAIAAPHVSPFGGIDAYRAAYSALSPDDAERTFIILGTSHYGEPDRLGLTRKPFVTPYGETRTDAAMVEEIAKNCDGASEQEDYCHAVEHSIEFQVIFLQHLFGPQIKIVPLLCGSYAESIYRGGAPESNDNVKRILGTLGELAAREGDRLLWVLGIDMAHMGRRYGDPFYAVAEQGEMAEVGNRDRARIDRMSQGDAAGFWELVQENRDDLKWCGSAPIYTFLRSVPQARGELLRYQQWNIDDQSVVTFAGMRFS